MRRIFSGIGMFLLFLIGFAVLGYPAFSNWIFERNTSGVIAEYELSVGTLSAHDQEEQLRLASEYNNSLSGADIQDPFVPGSGFVLPDNYRSILNVEDIMGYIDIPKINVYLPIRHSTSEESMRQGVGHFEDTALPIGGEGNHSALTAHRGLGEALLFTDLDQLSIGDVFTLHIMGDTLAYQVDQILVVESNETAALRPVAGKDYTTLVTCTPYGVNSHRLLVRGERIAYRVDDTLDAPLGEPGHSGINRREIVLLGIAVLWGALIVGYSLGRRNKHH